MRNFDENLLKASGLSAEDFFADEKNQQNVMDEIAAFGDGELTAAFGNLFNPPEGEDAYLTGNAFFSVEEVLRIGKVPEKDMQLKIVRHSPRDAVEALIGLGHLCAEAEWALFKRDAVLFGAYLERFRPYPRTFELLVRDALGIAAPNAAEKATQWRKQAIDVLKQAFAAYSLSDKEQDVLAFAAQKGGTASELAAAYIAHRPLSEAVLRRLLLGRAEKFIASYQAFFPLGAAAGDIPDAGEAAVLFWFPRLRRPEDKIALALGVRRKMPFGTQKKLLFCRDVSLLLQKAGAKDTPVISSPLTPKEECVLVQHPNKEMARSYLLRFPLSEQALNMVLKTKNYALFNVYVDRYELPAAVIQAIISGPYEKMFQSYVRRHRLKGDMLAYLRCKGTKEMILFYCRLGAHWPFEGHEPMQKKHSGDNAETL